MLWFWEVFEGFEERKKKEMEFIEKKEGWLFSEHKTVVTWWSLFSSLSLSLFHLHVEGFFVFLLLFFCIMWFLIFNHSIKTISIISAPFVLSFSTYFQLIVFLYCSFSFSFFTFSFFPSILGIYVWLFNY